MGPEPTKVAKKSRKSKEETESNNITNAMLESLVNTINKWGESVKVQPARTRQKQSEFEDGLGQLHRRLDKQERVLHTDSVLHSEPTIARNTQTGVGRSLQKDRTNKRGIAISRKNSTRD